VFVTKPQDEELARLVEDQGFVICRTAKEAKHFTREAPERVLFWPTQRGLADKTEQSYQFRTALEDMYERKSWTMVMDEMPYMHELLKLDEEIKTIFQQGRSNKITIVGCTQRPRGVPLAAFSQAIHLFFFRCSDQYDLERIRGIGGADAASVQSSVRSLRGHDFLYVNSREGTMLTSCVNLH
jgi:hypothetical protein